MVLSLGYSHPIEYKLPEGISAKVDKNVLILSGIDKEQLGAAAVEGPQLPAAGALQGQGRQVRRGDIVRKAGKTAGK